MLGTFKRWANGLAAMLIEMAHRGELIDVDQAMGNYRPPKGKGKGKGATGIDMARARGYVR
ncbi:hypothetical protein RU58_00030 [Achromobacter phage phiAxp-1]|uniref:hypothetical protein n=1 Tax=Achromobacter phage phiAxp-1 TaxID=1610509 RepID=UPI000655DED8|nr:hypothetical protein RU58_00030 [Achromobacter phage phiAxp-1]AKJ71419.1 hypothetical protein RU58_00030 [Achromobacter phage phiAxp-1]QDH84473.1 hypothetical protein Axy19_029 [Achromobacter phage vB_AxyS_19-32_Axy19]